MKARETTNVAAALDWWAEHGDTAADGDWHVDLHVAPTRSGEASAPVGLIGPAHHPKET